MRITNPDHDIIVDYDPIGNGEMTRNITFLTTGMTLKYTVPASAATADLEDLLTNYDYEEVEQAM